MMGQKEPLFMAKGFEDAIGNMFFVVSSRNQSGESVVKSVSYEQFMKILSSSYRVEEEAVRVGLVPQGYLDAKIQGHSWVVRIYVPEEKRCLLMSNGTPIPTGFMIPMPAMLFEVKCTEASGVWIAGKCCVVNGSYEEVKDAYMHGSLKQYMYQCGNLSNSCYICMCNILVEL